MKDRFDRYLISKGIFVKYYVEFHGSTQTKRRESWHADEPWDFWDDRNSQRFIQGAFDWSSSKDGFDFWSVYNGEWRKGWKCVDLNKNTRTI